MLEKNAVTRAIAPRIGNKYGLVGTERLLHAAHQRLAVGPLNVQILKSIDDRELAGKI